MVAIAAGLLTVAFTKSNFPAVFVFAGSALAGIAGCIATVLTIHFTTHEGGRILKLPLALALTQLVALITGFMLLVW